MIQVATIGPSDSQNPSARGSLVPGDGAEEAINKAKSVVKILQKLED